MPVNHLIRTWQDWRARIGNGPLVAAAVLVPVAILTGAALDFGMSIQVQKSWMQRRNRRRPQRLRKAVRCAPSIRMCSPRK
jgi:hypothetical protein